LGLLANRGGRHDVWVASGAGRGDLEIIYLIF
jgi:hypothetical protein